MFSFFNDFVAYFFPNFSSYPDWLGVLIGLFILLMFWNLISIIFRRRSYV